jgi:hypothetical protein
LSFSKPRDDMPVVAWHFVFLKTPGRYAGHFVHVRTPGGYVGGKPDILSLLELREDMPVVSRTFCLC